MRINNQNNRDEESHQAASQSRFSLRPTSEPQSSSEVPFGLRATSSSSMPTRPFMLRPTHTANDTTELTPGRSRSINRSIRQKFLVPIYLSITSDVPDRAAEAAVKGAEEALIASGQQRSIEVFTRPWKADGGPHSSAEWYVEEALRKGTTSTDRGYGKQVEFGALQGLLMGDPYQINPHWDVLVFNRDMKLSRDSNYCFGGADPSNCFSVQSVTRFLAEISDPSLQYIAIKRLIRHELGHLFGLVERDFNFVESLGRHCTNDCTMRQSLSMESFVSFAIQEEESGAHFCGDCCADLDERKGLVRELE